MPSNTPPIPDQFHISRIRDALWKNPGPGASVMVGSGFSRNAQKIRPDAAPPPLWKDIAQELLNELKLRNGDSEGRSTGMLGLSVDNPLRLAQAYEANIGRDELHDLLVRLVRDDDFVPGKEHLRLLSLPWRDVFTTNWDTLLERTGPNVAGRLYSVVNKMGQLPEMSQPRIIKLHGSLPSQFPLIITEEDYRTYPDKFDPFVNTVKQAMLETVFCLIGFSGSDPNFLEWAGWLRDKLGNSAPKIYLAGLLELSPPERTMLEGLNIVPIDLGTHPKAPSWPEDRRNEYATEWILHTLEGSGSFYDETTWPSPPLHVEIPVLEHLQPIDYHASTVPRDYPQIESNTNSPDYNNEPLHKARQVIDAWAHNRRIYPGWLVFPSGPERAELSWRTSDWEPHILKLLPDLEPVERLRALRELSWLREILLKPITFEFSTAAENALGTIDCESRLVAGVEVNGDDWAEIEEAWQTVAFNLVTDARLDCNQPLFERLLDALEQSCEDSSDCQHRIHHERCLWAVYSLDFEELSRLLDRWQLGECNQIWKIRKAALLTEIGRHDESGTLLEEALCSIRDNVGSSGNIAVATLESWALGSTLNHNTRSAVFRRWDELAALKCHSWDELDHVARAMRGTEEMQNRPSYELGISRTTRVRWSNERYTRTIAAYRAVRLPEVTGLPPVNIPSGDLPIPTSAASGVLKLAAGELATINPELSIRLILRVCTYDRDELLLQVLSRARVAILTDDVATLLAQTCIRMIKYTLPRLLASDETKTALSAVERMRVAMEILSRLALRLTPDMVNATLDIGLECYRTDRLREQYLIGPPLTSLLRWTWEALPKNRRAERVFDLLLAPIVGLDDFEAVSNFPDTSEFIRAEDIPSERTSDNQIQFEQAFHFLVRGLRGNEDARNRATLRLIWLVLSEGLTEYELEEIANALWGNADPVKKNASGPNTPLDWVYLVLPETKVGQALDSFRSKWLSDDSDGQETGLAYSSDAIKEVGVAMTGLRDKGRSLDMSALEEEIIAVHIERLVEMIASDSVSFNFSIGSAIERLGSLTANITIPNNIAENLFQKVEFLLSAQENSRDSIIEFLSDIRIAIGFQLVPGLVKAFPDRVAELAMWLRLGLASDDDVRVRNAMSALQTWVAELSIAHLPQVPEHLLMECGVIIASRRRVGLANALLCATWVFDKGAQSHQDAISPLVLTGLRHLAEELQYAQFQHDDQISTLRLLCVKLARSMGSHGFSDNPAVQQWLDEGKNDPFPEIRYAATPPDTLQVTTKE